MASSTTQPPPVTVSDELGAYEDSLAKAYSSFEIYDGPAAFDYQLSFLSDADSKSNVTRLCDNGSVEATRTTPLFSGKMLNGSSMRTFLSHRPVAESPKEADGGWGKEYIGHLAWVMSARIALEDQGSSGLSLSIGWPRRGRHLTPLGLEQIRGIKGAGWMRVRDNTR